MLMLWVRCRKRTIIGRIAPKGCNCRSQSLGELCGQRSVLSRHSSGPLIVIQLRWYTYSLPSKSQIIILANVIILLLHLFLPQLIFHEPWLIREWYLQSDCTTITVWLRLLHMWLIVIRKSENQSNSCINYASRITQFSLLFLLSKSVKFMLFMKFLSDQRMLALKYSAIFIFHCFSSVEMVTPWTPLAGLCSNKRDSQLLLMVVLSYLKCSRDWRKL